MTPAFAVEKGLAAEVVVVVVHVVVLVVAASSLAFDASVSAKKREHGNELVAKAKASRIKEREAR